MSTSCNSDLTPILFVRPHRRTHRRLAGTGAPGRAALGTALFAVAAALDPSAAPAQTLWTAPTGSAWLTASNWTGSTIPGPASWAQFGANPTSATVGIGINFSNTTNAGVQVNGQRIQETGAIEVTSARSANLLIGNSSSTAGSNGQLRLTGSTINAIPNTIIRHAGTGILTVQGSQGSGNQSMDLILGNATANNIRVTASGVVAISSNITGSASGSGLVFSADDLGQLILSGTNNYAGGTQISGTGSGQLRIESTASLPMSGGVTVNGGGRLTLSAAGTYGGTGQTLTLNPSQTANPAFDTLSNGTMTWQGPLALAASSRVDVNGAGSTVALSGVVSGSGTLIKNGTGTLTLTASNTLTGPIIVDAGTLILTGSISPSSLTVAQTGSAIFSQTGGSVATSRVSLGAASGSTGYYTLSDGSVTSTREVDVGYAGAGSFTQSGGTVTTPFLVVGGRLTGATGAYVISGGTVNAVQGEIRIGFRGTGSFTQTGGTVTANDLSLGFTANSYGTYALHAGSLALVNSMIIGYSGGTGSFTQTGGTLTTFYLSLGQSGSGSRGTYALSAGSLSSTGYIRVGESGSGSFTQSGGTVSTNTLSIGDLNGSTGAYALSAGSVTLTSLATTSGTYVGNAAIGTFTQSGGTLATPSLYVGFKLGSAGVYTLSDGSVESSTTYVGSSGTGSFAQTGGTVTTPALIVADNSGSSGTYFLSGGNLITPSIAKGAGAALFTFNGGTLTASGNTSAQFSNFSPLISTGGAKINTAAFAVTLNWPLLHDPALAATPDGGLTKLGNGTLTLPSGNTYTGPTTVSAGMLRLAAQPAPVVALLNALSITSTGTLDLTNNLLIVRDTSLETLRQYASAAYAGGTRTGPGLTTSQTAIINAIDYAAIALFPNLAPGGNPYFATLGGIPLLPTDVIARFTYLGDTNINGRLDATDLANFLEGYSLGLTGWQNGDFDHNGTINAADYTLLTTALTANLPPLASPTDLPPTGTGSMPEPSSLALLSLATLPLSRRRR